MQKRKHKRFTKRIEAEFFFGDRKIRGITSDLSAEGLFVRTRYPLATGSAVELTLYLSNGKMAHVQGTVRRAVKSQSTLIKSGMGIELTGYDDAYTDFLSGFLGHGVAHTGMADREYKAVRGGPDRIDSPKTVRQGSEASSSPEPDTAPPSQPPPEYQILACPSCNVKNKIPVAKMSLGPKCGKCKAPLTV